MYMYVYAHPPLDTQKCTSWCPGIHRATDPEIPKIRNSKNPNIQNYKTPKMQTFFARFRRREKIGYLNIWIFGFLDFCFLDFWIFGFWIFRPVDIWTAVTVFPCTLGARVGQCHHLYMHHIYTYIHTYKYVHEHTPLAKPGFRSDGRIFSKPTHGALLSTSISHNDDSNSRNYCALLGTSTNSNNDSSIHSTNS